MVDEKATTVYKRALGEEYRLKMKSARSVLSEVNKRYPCMPFPLRKLLATGNASKFGLVECTTHQLLQPYPVLWEKEGGIVAHIKGTVLLMPNGSDRITTAPLQEVQSDKRVEARLTFRFRAGCSWCHEAKLSWVASVSACVAAARSVASGLSRVLFCDRNTTQCASAALSLGSRCTAVHTRSLLTSLHVNHQSGLTC